MCFDRQQLIKVYLTHLGVRNSDNEEGRDDSGGDSKKEC